ncbi:FHA domain-containing protein [Microbacterium pygmaeum]|uniref:FHA domain-containing protein n=1 Tax=Microbacterium pygmaeum TaxID=370764 RepID=A0A1G7U8D8_9MICO|nr:FHA domain-containing protein [Microbacterium pygmaeum]SDG43010.1 FHA domain-containing protein [Microbacterium pygmaeum]
MAGSVRYSRGGAAVIVTGSGLVVVGGDAPPTLASRVWEDVSAGRGLAGVLEGLTGAFGTSLAAIPPFAVALSESGSVRLAVRGDMSVRVVTATGTETISGAGVTTWSERVLEDVLSVHVDTADGDGEPAVLPIADGVVLGSTVDWHLDGAQQQRTGSTPGGETRAPIAPVVPRISAGAPQPVRGPLPDDTRAPSAGPAAPALQAAPVAQSAAADPQPAAPEQPVAPPGFLIDSIPSALTIPDGDTLLPADSTLAAEEAPFSSGPQSGLDALWGATVARAPEVAGDHDGETISVAEARALRAAQGGDPSIQSPVPLDSAPPSLAPPRPAAPGRLRLSTGQELLLDRTVVIGRRPRSTRVTGTDLPHLVAVDSPQQDISRSHVEFRVEGDSIVATDLHTTNGTTLHRAGVDPMRLHPGEPTVVVPGDVVDLGDAVTVEIVATEGVG